MISFYRNLLHLAPMHSQHINASISACIRLCMPSSILMRLQDLQVPPDYCGTMRHYLSAEHNQM